MSSRGRPVERVRDEHPTDEEWRADALAASRHSRLLDELRAPQAEADPERAAALCGEVCRNALRDLAPALILLPAAERRRAQALAAYVLTLFDFARQTGLEGERLAQINRWQFQLEETLGGEPAVQPIFVTMQLEERRRPWEREGLDALANAARQRVASRRPATAEAREAEVARLSVAICTALLGTDRGAEAADLVAGLLRLVSLLDLGEGLRRHDARLPSRELPDEWNLDSGDEATLTAAVRRECDRARPLLRPAGSGGLPPAWRPAARFLELAGRRLLRSVEQAGAEVARQPPRLGIGSRLALLVRARWL